MVASHGLEYYLSLFICTVGETGSHAILRNARVEVEPVREFVKRFRMLQPPHAFIMRKREEVVSALVQMGPKS